MFQTIISFLNLIPSVFKLAIQMKIAKRDIHTYIHTYLHTYLLTYILTYILINQVMKNQHKLIKNAIKITLKKFLPLKKRIVIISRQIGLRNT